MLAAAGALVLLAVLLTPRVVADGGFASVDEARLLRTPHDDFIHVTHRAEQLRRRPSSATTIYLLGGSGTMECFKSESSLAAAIATRRDQPVQVVSLAAAQESMAMSLVLVDNLPPQQATVAIGLSPIRFIGSPERDARILWGDPLLLRSPHLTELSRTYYSGTRRRTGLASGFFAYVGSYLRTRMDSGATPGSRIRYLTHYWNDGDEARSPLAKRLDVLTVLADHKERYRLYGDYNLAVLEEILRVCEARGYRAVLFDQPLNVSAGGPDWAGVVPAYRSAAQLLSRRYGVPYLHIARRVELADDDFFDLFHLLAPARLKWQPEMARELAATLAAPEGPGAPLVAVARRAPASP